MNSSQKVLVLYTNNYPYHYGESFIENEIEFLSKEFDFIYIVPFYNNYETKRTIPANCSVLNVPSFEKFNGKKILIKYFFRYLTIFIGEFLREKNKKGFLKLRKSLRSQLLQSFFRAEQIVQLLSSNKINENAVHYSFWCNNWVTSLSILRKKKLYTRVHGFDLYHDRRDNQIIPFRNFQLRHIKHVFCVSQFAQSYLQKHYPSFKSKYSTAPLYVSDRGTNPWNDQNKAVIVSCSNIIPLKRVELIANALAAIQRPLLWVHFGAGDTKQLKEIFGKFPKEVEVLLKGQVSNNEIIEFYRKQPVNVFLHMSSSEGGIPVAIQEAISFGIPVIATNAGGVPEIVNEKTGILIDSEDVTPEKVEKTVLNFLNSELNTMQFRTKVKKYWKDKFSAESNYAKFCKEISE